MSTWIEEGHAETVSLRAKGNMTVTAQMGQVVQYVEWNDNQLDVSVVSGNVSTSNCWPSNPNNNQCTRIEGPWGAEVTIQATPNAPWSFSHWRHEEEGSKRFENPVTLILGAPEPIEAMAGTSSGPFHTVTGAVTGEGAVLGAQRTGFFILNTVFEGSSFQVQDGETAILNARAAPGWAFKEWEETSGTFPFMTATITQAATYTAKFIEHVYLHAYGEGHGWVSGDPAYFSYNPLDETEVTLTGVGCKGFVIEEWEAPNGSGWETVHGPFCDREEENLTYSVVMDEDHTVKATFHEDLACQYINRGALALPDSDDMVLECEVDLPQGLQWESGNGDNQFACKHDFEEDECDVTNTTGWDHEHEVDDTVLDGYAGVLNEFGDPIRVTSMFRCPVHNEGSGFSQTSNHVTGNAFDYNNGPIEPNKTQSQANWDVGQAAAGVAGISKSDVFLYPHPNDGLPSGTRKSLAELELNEHDPNNLPDGWSMFWIGHIDT